MALLPTNQATVSCLPSQEKGLAQLCPEDRANYLFSTALFVGKFQLLWEANRQVGRSGICSLSITSMGNVQNLTDFGVGEMGQSVRVLA